MEKLLQNIRTIVSSAEIVYANKDYTSATILYFKVLFGITDFILLREQGKAPKDHTERFRMLEVSNKDIYEFLDKYFKVYRDTYSILIDKQTCDKVRENVKKFINKYKI